MDDIFADLDLLMYKNVNSLFNIGNKPEQKTTSENKKATTPIEGNLLDDLDILQSKSKPTETPATQKTAASQPNVKQAQNVKTQAATTTATELKSQVKVENKPTPRT